MKTLKWKLGMIKGGEQYMDEYDLFSLTGLSFDPPEKAPKIVRIAIDKAITDLTGIWNTESQDQKKKDIRKKLDFLESCLEEGTVRSIFKNGKLNAHYEELAQNRVARELENLCAIVNVLKQSGSKKITNGTVRSYRKQTKLSSDHVKQVFIDAGYSYEDIDPLKAVPKFPTQVEKLHEDLATLRETDDPNPDGTDRTSVKDIYSFIAYMSGEPENVTAYQIKTTSELKTLCNGFSQKYSGHQPPLQKIWGNIASAGKTYIFNTEESREAYENYLKYKAPALTSLFATFKKIPSTTLLESKFAEGCIKKISEVFGDYEIALAIYNKEAGLKDEPYINIEAKFYVKCGYCQSLLEFSDINEAQEKDNGKGKGNCPHCGKALYKTCNKCKCLVLTSLDKCPECGFVFASAVMFAKFFAVAEKALRDSDFNEARNNMFQAQSADPGEKTRIAELEARITAEEKRYEKPINELRKLLADKKMQRASEVLADTISEFPKLNVTVFDSQIQSTLNSARASFANAKKLSPSKQADVCLDILQECVDFKPAINFLRMTPPIPCKSFSVGLDSSGWCANLSWSRSLEQGVTYRVVRKLGKDIPVNEVDGDLLLDNTTETAYRDKTIEPGRNYSYGVFAIRYGIFSSAAGKSVVLLADVTDVHCNQHDKTLRLTWNNPKNCTGVSIQRTSEGTTKTLTNNANGSFEDKDVKYGASYTYKLCANYNGLSPSRGVELVITPMLKIDSFTIRVEQLRDTKYKIYWDIELKGIDLRILVDEKLSHELKSDVRFYEISLPADGFHTVAVMAYSGGYWLRSSNDVQVNTYSPCSIDKQATQFREKPIVGVSDSAYNIELGIRIKEPIPNNVIGFYYAVRIKGFANEGAPWADKEEIGTVSDIRKIDLASYKSSGEILCSEKARDEGSYYVSLFTIYNFKGTEVISNASKCRFDRPLIVDLFWKVTKGLFSGYKMTVEISGNRPFDRIPELVLYACSEGQHLQSPNDPKGRKIQVFPETTTKDLSQTYQLNYEINKNANIRGLKLFLFESNAIPSENYILRRTKGFSGKV